MKSPITLPASSGGTQGALKGQYWGYAGVKDVTHAAPLLTAVCATHFCRLLLTRVDVIPRDREYSYHEYSYHLPWYSGTTCLTMSPDKINIEF